jgi:hypothetical protein
MWNLRRLVIFSSLVAVMLAMASGGLLAQKKKKDADPDHPAATEADYAALKSTLFPAKIVTLEAGKTVTVRVEFTKKESNPNYKPLVTNPGAPGYNAQDPRLVLQKKLADLNTQLQRTAKNAQPIITRINQDIASTNAQLTKINNDPVYQAQISVTRSKDYDLDFEKKVVYRKMKLPEKDADGNPLKYTAEELLAFRGSESPPLPGYIAKAEDLEEGQEVKLYLTLPKKKAKTDDDTTPAEHATIKMIVVTKKAGEVDTPKKK